MSDRWGADLGSGTSGVPGVLAVAHRARALAAEVRHAAASVRAADDGTWRGRVADLAAQRRREVASRLDGCAADLDDVARVAGAHATTAADRVDELERLVRAARGLLDTAGEVVR